MAETVGKMVCGFLFYRELVVLVKKNRPQWQEGLWNGIGGHVEPNETPQDAMVRECIEETGIAVFSQDWRHFATEVEPFGNAYVYFYTVTLATVPQFPPTNDSGEQLSVFHFDTIPKLNCIGNLKWLIPMARDPRLVKANIDANGDIRKQPTW